jgi:hypothetical protein
MRRGKLCRRVAELPCETSVNRSPSACCKQGHVSVREVAGQRPRGDAASRDLQRVSGGATFARLHPSSPAPLFGASNFPAKSALPAALALLLLTNGSFIIGP